MNSILWHSDLVDQKRIIISGGGICGLACALAAAQAGYSVVVLEKAAAFESLGAGLQLGPNAVRALQSLNAWNDVAKVCQAPAFLAINDAVSGKLLRQLNLDGFQQRFGAPYRVARRADLHAALLQGLEKTQNVELFFGERVISVDSSHGTVRLETESGLSFDGQGLIIADGIHSILRKQLWPKSTVVDSGLTFHRAPLATGAAHKNRVELWLGPQMHMVRYDVGDPLRGNLVCITQNDKHPSTVADSLCNSAREILESVENWSVWPGLYVSPLENWSHGRCIILGDAAHGTLPFLAQGAAMALEDAAWLKFALQADANLVQAFAKHNERMQRTKLLHRASLKQGRIYHHSGIVGQARNFVLKHIPEMIFHQQLTWIYQYTE